MEVDGLEIDALELRSRPLPLSGKYLEVDGARYMLDREGYVTLPRPRSLAAIKVLWQLTDIEEFGVIAALNVAPVGQEPPETSLTVTYRPPGDMNAGPGGGGWEAGAGGACTLPMAVDGCPLRDPCTGGNDVPCCLDYEGPAGDGQPRWRFTNPNFPMCPVDLTCKSRAYRNFVGSTCYDWVFNRRGRPCAPETIGSGPGCWFRHKYRNCQNMDENEFTLQASPAVVKFGDEVRLTIVNNTAANSTTLRIEPAAGKGDLQLPPGAPPVTLVRDGGGWRLDHWDDGQQQHFEGVQLRYVTPQKDSTGKCVATYKIIAEADGLRKEVEIRVLPKRNAWQGTTKRTQITDVGPLHNEVITDAIVLFDIDGGTVSGTAIFTETQTAGPCRLTGSTTAPIVPRPETFLEVDFTNDPPIFRGMGMSTFTVELTQVCDGVSNSETVQLDQAPWLDTLQGGRQFFTATDGCTCTDTNDLGVFGASHITFEWDLKKLPDP